MAHSVKMENNSDNNLSQNRIIVIVPDEPGSLAKVTEALGNARVNIEAIDVHNAQEFGLISLNTDDDDAALHALLDADLRAVTSDAVIFHLKDEPGALARVAQRFGENRVNVRTIHIVHRFAGHAIVAVTTDDDDLARSLLDRDILL